MDYKTVVKIPNNAQTVCSFLKSINSYLNHNSTIYFYFCRGEPFSFLVISDYVKSINDIICKYELTIEKSPYTTANFRFYVLTKASNLEIINMMFDIK